MLRNSDSLSQGGAERLAERIETYWRLRGYFGIKTTLDVFPLGDKFGYAVRSNIGPKGFPPKLPEKSTNLAA